MDLVVGLNIKNPDAERRIRELANLTGESLTQAVITAVEERLDRVRPPMSDRVARAMEIGRRARAKMGEPWWKEGEDPAAYLYDENGLPK